MAVLVLHSYIDAVAETGANAIKFQTHIAEAESSKFEKFRTKFSYLNESRYDYWKRVEFKKLSGWKFLNIVQKNPWIYKFSIFNCSR